MLASVSRISMISRTRLLPTLSAVPSTASAMYSNGGHAEHGMGELGSGSGKGGGTGGSVRDAGGSFGKMEQAREEEYFRRLQKLQLKNLHEQLDDEVDYHEHQLKHHQEAIERHQKRMRELKKEEKELEK